MQEESSNMVPNSDFLDNNKPLNIAIVSPYDFSYPGGVTNHVENLYSQLKKRGHSVKIAAPSSLNSNTLDDPDFIAIGKPISIPTAGSVARITLSLRLGKNVQDFISSKRFDIVHIHEPVSPTLPLTFLRLVEDSALVGTFHAYAKRRTSLSLSRFILRKWASKLHKRIAVSEAAHEYIDRYLPGDYEIIPNGVDLEKFSKNSINPEKFNDGKINILFQGRMEKRKGFNHLLKAYSNIKWTYPNSRIIVVGPGNIDREGRQIIAERGLTDINFVGFVPEEDLPGYYQAADIFCSPATGDESQGIVLLQSMAAGTPVLASSIAGYKTVITNNKDGILIDPLNESIFSSALLNLVENKTLRRTLSSQGLKTIEKYDWNVVTEKILTVYKEAILKKKNPN